VENRLFYKLAVWVVAEISIPMLFKNIKRFVIKCFNLKEKFLILQPLDSQKSKESKIWTQSLILHPNKKLNQKIKYQNGKSKVHS